MGGCRMAEAVGDAQLYVNGEYRDGTAGRRDVASPVTGELIGSVPVPGQDDIDAAVTHVHLPGSRDERLPRGSLETVLADSREVRTAARQRPDVPRPGEPRPDEPPTLS